MGPSFTDEIHSAIRTVFRFLNWHAAIVADLYQKRILQRYEGFEDDSCLDILASDITPPELKYPIPVNSVALMNIRMQATGANRIFGPVSPARRPTQSHFESLGFRSSLLRPR